MSKLIYIDTKDISFVLETTVYEEELTRMMEDHPTVRRYRPIPDDEIVREFSVTFKNGKTITVTGNDAVAELESRLGVSIKDNGEVIES